MHENLIREISIIGVSILNLAITVWYCWLTYKQKIKPALAMWIFFTIAVAISLTTYMESAQYSFLDNILNTTDLALTAIVSVAIYFFGDHTSRFSRFDKGCLLAVTIILLFWPPAVLAYHQKSCSDPYPDPDHPGDRLLSRDQPSVENKGERRIIYHLDRHVACTGAVTPLQQRHACNDLFSQGHRLHRDIAAAHASGGVPETGTSNESNLKPR